MLQALKHFAQLYFSTKGSADRAPIKHFHTLAHIGHEAARQLLNHVRGLGDKKAVIEDLEHRGDRAVAECHHYLDVTFIPLYDREDVTRLASRLDDVIDGIKKALRHMRTYNLTDLTFAVEMAIVMEQSMSVLSGIVLKMPLFDRETLRTALGSIDDCEKKADELFEVTLTRMFESIGADSPISKQSSGIKEVLHQLERVTDACKHAGEIVDTIARKQGI